MRKLVLVLLLFAAPACGANLYIRAGATGANNGADWTNAYTDIPSSLICGDTYYFAAGTYASGGHVFDDGCSSQTTLQTATTSDHGTSTGWSDSYAGQVTFYNLQFVTGYYTFNGVYRSAMDSGYGMRIAYNSAINNYHIWFNGGGGISHVTFEYVEIPGAGQNNSSVVEWALFARYGFCIPGYACAPSGTLFSYITFDYDYIHDIAQGGVLSYNNLTNLDVEYTEFARTTSTSGYHGAALNDTGNTDTITFAYNKVIDVDGTAALDMHEASSGIYESMDHYYVYGNIFWQQTAGNYVGDGIIACINGQTCSHWRIYNNTFVNFVGTSSHQGLSWDESNASSTDVIHEDNLYYNVRDATILTSAAGQITSDYNYYSNCTYTPTETNSEYTSTDPFTSLSGGDFHLASETNDGIHLASPYNVDPDGVTRAGPDGIWSRGAYQYGSSSLTAPTFTPTSYDFGSLTDGTSSTAYDFTLTNTSSSSALAITSVSIVGIVPAQFSQTNTCGSSVAASGTCTISVTFAPTISGVQTGTLQVADNAPGSPHSANLSGTGVTPSSVTGHGARGMGIP